jgi:hypothetical protein
MFHRGEKGAAIWDEVRSEWVSVMVLIGLCDHPPRKLHFTAQGPEFSGGSIAGLRAVLRRRDNGVRLLVQEDFSIVEVEG